MLSIRYDSHKTDFIEESSLYTVSSNCDVLITYVRKHSRGSHSIYREVHQNIQEITQKLQKAPLALTHHYNYSTNSSRYQYCHQSNISRVDCMLKLHCPLRVSSPCSFIIVTMQTFLTFIFSQSVIYFHFNEVSNVYCESNWIYIRYSSPVTNL